MRGAFKAERFQGEVGLGADKVRDEALYVRLQYV